MRTLAVGALLVGSVALAACGDYEDHDVFRIEMRPKDGAVERTVRVSYVDGEGKPQKARPEVVATTEAAYGAGGVAEDHETRFAGTFTGRLPSDVGGNRGSVVRLRSTFGDLLLYSERFGADGDAEARIERRRAEVDGFVDRLVRWAREETRDEADRDGVERLLTLLDVDLRKDARNVAHHFDAAEWAAAWGGKGPDDSMVWSAVAHHLAERGWFRLEDLPRLFREVEGREGEEYAVLRRSLARRLGHPDDRPVPAFLGIFRRDRLATFDLEAKEEAEPARTPGLDLHRPLVTVRLALPVEPHGTTGAWDAASGTVSFDLEWSDVAPRYAIAAWAVPDAAEQERRLGGVLLRGKRLGDFVRWEQALDAAEREAWLASVLAKDRGTSVADWVAGLALPGPRGARAVEELRAILAGNGSR